MDRPSGRRLSFLNEHVNPCPLAVFQTERFRGFRDLLEIFAPDGDVDIFCQASGIWLDIFDLKISCQTPDSPVLESSGRKDLLDQVCQVKEL